MEIELHKAGFSDCETLHRMQVICFQPLLDRYGDTDTNPAAEPIERIQSRMRQDETDYYFIRFNGETIGAIRVVRLPDSTSRISPMFILPAFQGRGLAQQTLARVEQLYPDAIGWQLDTIKEEARLCHLYEKMGYKRTGREERLQDDMTIVFYAK